MSAESSNLTLKTLQEAFAEILFGDVDKGVQYVLPRQGNLQSAIQQLDVASMFLFYIRDQRKILNNHAYGLDHRVNVVTLVELQGVGMHAETYMQSTLFWDERRDVQDIFWKRCSARLHNSDRRVVTAPFLQDGNNTQLSYNTTLRFVNTLAFSEEDTDDKHFGELVLKGKLSILGD